MKYITVKHRFPRHILTTPVILLAIVPLLILDFYVEIFHRFAFPFYNIPYVKRKNYIRIDRHKEGNGFIPQSHHAEFIKYNNKEEYNEVYESKKTPLL